MSRPAIAAWYKCHTRVLSLSDSSLNPSAYTCTTAASSTRSSRYFRSGGAAVAGALPEFEPPAQAALAIIDMVAMILFTLLIHFTRFAFSLSRPAPDIAQYAWAIGAPTESSSRAPRQRPVRREQ